MIYGLFPNYDYISALVISACLTPTDPIISAAVIGKLLRSVYTTFPHIRRQVAGLPINMYLSAFVRYYQRNQLQMTVWRIHS